MAEQDSQPCPPTELRISSEECLASDEKMRSSPEKERYYGGKKKKGGEIGIFVGKLDGGICPEQ